MPAKISLLEAVKIQARAVVPITNFAVDAVDAAEARVRPGWQLARTQTLIQGAPACDFRWKQRAP